ncbi:MAG: hypothetical protein ACXAAK_14055, partial [Candidatus Thorarchaeota archaeon]
MPPSAIASIGHLIMVKEWEWWLDVDAVYIGWVVVQRLELTILKYSCLNAGEYNLAFLTHQE